MHLDRSGILRRACCCGGRPDTRCHWGPLEGSLPPSLQGDFSPPSLPELVVGRFVNFQETPAGRDLTLRAGSGAQSGGEEGTGTSPQGRQERAEEAGEGREGRDTPAREGREGKTSVLSSLVPGLPRVAPRPGFECH